MFLGKHRTIADRFGAIYHRRMWQNPESASGFGSTMEATGQLRAGLEALFAEHEVTSWLDAPCGDFNWQGAVAFGGTYIGADIVPELIADTSRAHAGEGRSFIVADIARDTLPQAEAVLCRECLNHLPLADGLAALANLEGAASRFVMVTHYPDCTANAEQPASFRYRPLNLTRAPFDLRGPDASIDEGAFEPGKQVAIWDLAKGPLRRR